MPISCRSRPLVAAFVKSPAPLPAGLGLALFFLLAAAGPAWSQPLPLPQDLQNQVNRSIDWGVDFLLKNQNPNGSWGAHQGGQHEVGYAALPGLTLLECAVAPTNPVVQRAAAFVRTVEAVRRIDTTYDLALGILFLDKLGDPKDKPLIRTFILRLIAGQTATGGWGYRCPVLTRAEHQLLVRILQRDARVSPAYLTPLLRRLPLLQAPGQPLQDPPHRSHEPVGGTTDNSNTQFATLAMWTARRYDVPTEPTLNLLVNRFRTSQNQDGSWGYYYRYGGGDPERKAMTCVGLLGLAVGHGLANDGSRKLDPGQVSFQMPFSPRHVALLFFAADEVVKLVAGNSEPKKPQDDKVLNGLVAMGKNVGRPTGRAENLRQENLYYLWSVERVAVLYGLRTIGDKDWYRWGAEILVANQNISGSWKDGGYYGSTPPIDTCLALLFLKRVNLASDLTTRLPFDPGELTMYITVNSRSAPAEPSSTTTQPALVTTDVSRAPDAKLLSGTLPHTLAVDGAAAPPDEEGGGKKWLWLLGLVALLLFVGSGILLAHHSMQKGKHDRRQEGRRKKRRNGTQGGAAPE